MMVLIVPELSQSQQIGSTVINAASKDVPLLGLITKLFDRVENAESYQFKVQIKDPVSGTLQPLGSLRSSQEAIFSEGLPYGTYLLSYRPIKNGKPGNWSEAQELLTPYPTVEVESPEPNQVLKAKKTKRPVVFKWKKTELIYRFKIDIENIETKKSITKVTTSPSLTISLGNDKSYRYRIYPDSDIKPTKDPTWRYFSISRNSGKNQLEAPSVTEASYDVISWVAVLGASQYQVSLFVKIGKKPPKRLFRSKVTATELSLKKFTKMTKGRRYVVELIAIDDQGGKSKPVRVKISKAGAIEAVGTELAGIKIKDQLPDTNLRTNLDLYYGGENLKASGLVGNFDGTGSVVGGALSIEILPKPESNMIYMQVGIEADRFESISQVANASSGTTDTVTTSLSRTGGSLVVTGRSDLSQEFYGFGLNMFTQPMPIFEVTDEETGSGSLDSINLRGIGAAFHLRHKFLGGMLLHNYDYAPISTSTINISLLNINLRQRYQISKTFEASAGLRVRYVDAKAQSTCSKNQIDFCSNPVSTQVLTVASLGVNLYFD